MPIITIRGRLGSGAQEIGRKVAEELQIDYIDREIIAEVAARLNLQEQEVLAKEMPPTGIRARIAEALARGYSIGDGIQGVYLPISQLPLDDSNYVKALTSFIKELAETQSVVIYGRGSQFILKDYPHALHVSVIAPKKTRMRRIIEARQISEDEAKQEINHTDSVVQEFDKRFFGADIDDALAYDIIINTEHITFQGAVKIILKASSLKEVDSSLTDKPL